VRSRKDVAASDGPIVLSVRAEVDRKLRGVSLNGVLDMPCTNCGVGFRFFDLLFALDFPFTLSRESATRTLEPSPDEVGGDLLEMEYAEGSWVEPSLKLVGIRVDRKSKSTRNGLVSLTLRKTSSLISTKPSS
jgi:hypothetical protein